MRYVGSVLDYTSQYTSASVTLLDAAVNYDWRQWHWSVNLANALDRTYKVNCGALTCNYGDLRTIRGTASYSW